MKREEIKEIFPEATDEQLKAIMDLNGKEVERNKQLDAELKASKDAYNELTGQFEVLKESNATAEDWQKKFETLQSEMNEREKQIQAEKIENEKQANIKARFKSALGDKKFNHKAIEEAYFQMFRDALENPENSGKGDVEIFHSLTKDDPSAFKGIDAIKLNGGTPSNGKEYTSKDEIMAIKNRTERRAAIARNLDLFKLENQNEE